MMNGTSSCRNCGATLIVKQTQRKPSQLKQPYYFTAYYSCPKCGRLYHDEKFKVVNENFELFTTDVLSEGGYDVEIWTDGASTNNGRENAKAAWAFVAGEHEERGLVEGKQTNNRAEAYAIYYGLKWAGEKGYKRIKLHTDSQISLHGVAKEPHLVKENREIFQQIYDVVNQYNLEVTYVKVLGHSGDVNNERADKLANSLASS